MAKLLLNAPKFFRSRLRRSRVMFSVESVDARKNIRSRMRDPGGFRKNGLFRTLHETIQHKNEEDFCGRAQKCAKFSRSRLRRSRVEVSSLSGMHSAHKTGARKCVILADFEKWSD